MNSLELNIRKHIQLLNDVLYKRTFINKSEFERLVDQETPESEFMETPVGSIPSRVFLKTFAKPNVFGNYYSFFIDNVKRRLA